MSLSNIILRRRGTGWIPNTPDDRDISISKLGLSVYGLPDNYSMRDHIPSIRNQLSTSSCVGQAIANAMTLREVAVYKKRFPNRDPKPLSALFPYWNSRYLHGSTLNDGGTYIRLAMKAVRRLGIPDEDYWKFSSNPLRVNKKPDMDAYFQATDRSGGLFVNITDIGTSRADTVRAAVAADLPVVFGANIDVAFMINDGPDVIDLPTNPKYGHAMVIIGYIRTTTGFIYEILNSWGPNWRINGRAYITERYLKHLTNVRDLTVIHGWRSII